MNRNKVERPTIGTFLKCAVTLRHEDPGGFYNTGTVATGFDPVVYISSLGAQQLAQAEGWVNPIQHNAVVEELARTEAELERAVAEISDLRKWKEAVDALAAEGTLEILRRGGAPSKKTKPETIREELKAVKS